MVRYSRGHREETRQQIVEAASRAFRRGGLTEVSIPRLMGEVGLTHGGFYAHFESKEALIAEAIAWSLQKAAHEVEEEVEDPSETSPLRAVLDDYLSRGHRDHPDHGCVMPALASQIARGSPEVREEFTEAVDAYLRAIDRALHPGTAARTPSDDALVLVSGMVGAVLLSRAVSDPDLSDRILRTSREFLLRSFGESRGEAP